MKEKWELLEEYVANKFCGKKVSGSGSPKFCAGDVITSIYLIECKYTDKNSKSLKLSEWEKIKKQAFDLDRIPLLVYQIKDKIFLITELEYFYDKE